MRALFLIGFFISTPAFAAETPKTAQAMGLLKTNCLGCHQAEKRKGGLSLETRALALEGGEHGPALVPGESARSRLTLQLAAGSDPHMPPKKQLAEKHIAVLRSWVDAGAPWDEQALKSFGAIAEASKLGALPAAAHPVIAIALSPDATKLASSSGGNVLIRDVRKPERPVIATLQGHKDLVQSIAWSPDGNRIAAGGYRTVLVWNARTGGLAETLGAPLEGRVSALAFLPDGRTLAVADGAQGQRGQIHLWPVGAAKPAATLAAHADNILCMALSHDGKLLATGGADHVAKIWNIAQRRQIAKLEGHTNHVLGIAFNKDDTWLATGGADKELKVWDIGQKQQIILLGAKKSVITSLHWTADGGKLIATDDEGAPRVYSDFKVHDGVRYGTGDAAKEGKLQAADTMLHAATATADGGMVFAGSDKGAVFAWSQDGKLAKLEAAPQAPSSKPQASPLSFTNDILPILSKSGCNLGACHAKASGQAGLKLSVFAYDPKSDYAELVQDARGRRVFPALPEESLILKKPTVAIQHEGGQRFESGSPQFQTIVEWIRQGAPYQSPGEPLLTGIEVSPAEQQYAGGASQQLKITARFSGGGTRDVTALTEYASNDKAVATVGESGLVRAGPESGEAVIIARYLGHVAISRVNIPTDKPRPDAAYAKLPVRNEIDRLVYARLKKLGVLPGDDCTDAEFLRRASLDAAGRLPTVAEARVFLDSKDPRKRDQWIEHLLEDPAWADHWAVKWGDLIRPNPSRVGVKPVLLLDGWIRQKFRANTPWDRFVSELLTAQGGTHQYGPVAVWRDKRDPADAATFVGQIFLGVRLECAKCHHHPSEKWDQTDYYQLAAFFTAMKRKGQGISAPISGEPEFIWSGGNPGLAHPVTNAPLKPRPPAASEIPIADNEDPRAVLAGWMTRPDNPYFAKALVNRVWAAFFGRGIVDPVDDFRASNPPSNEPLLDWLAADFIEHKFDLKHTMRTILQSRVYQLGSLPNDTNKADLKNYSHSYRRRLPAEVLLDAVGAVTETTGTFAGLSKGATAKQTWNVKLESEFMDAFGRPNSSAECPCERDARPSVVQALHLMNSSKLQARLNSGEGRAARLAASPMAPEQIVEELYLAALARRPAADEREIAAGVIASAGGGKRAAIEDVLWALLNSAEFVFNH